MREALARAGWVVGLPLRVLALGLIRGYRAAVSPLLGSRCRFHPSCSAYAEEAVRVHGVAKGVALAAWRVLRCSPLTAGGLDPVPLKGRWRSYDDVTQGAP